MRLSARVFVGAAAAMVPLLCLAQSPGQIVGRVVIENSSSAVAGATVSVVRVGAPIANPAPYSAQTYTGTNGMFSLSGVQPGRLAICVTAEGTDLLPTCEWDPPRILDVLPGKTGGLEISMERGKRLRFEIDDPKELLDKNEKPGTGVRLLVGVWTPGRTFLPAGVTRRDKKGRDQEVLVPFEVDIGLGVHGKKLVIEDDKAKRVKVDDVPDKIKVGKGEGPGAKALKYKVKDLEP
ncbi:MAG: carboxypeptidase-like regulatory domain-containing protein [Bryobacteraceae bacterium]